MHPLTINIREDQAALLEELSGDSGEYDSKSEAIRSIIDEYERIEELENEVERLHRERRQLLEQREENQELVEYVEQERSLSERKAKAGLLTRTKWFLVGMD